ncbi:MAG: hypothetical protein Q8P51_12420 [Ignavibacteria bacterium]|nr:hypothetical protein [Ignavibacteria bacterium]
MKILVAAEGNTLNNLVAARFERGMWYLTVGDRMSLIRRVENLGPRARKTAIQQACKDGVETVVTGDLGLHSYNLVALYEMKVAIVPQMAVREALEKLKKGIFKVLDSSMIGEIAHEQVLRRMQQRMVFRGKETRGTIKRVGGTRD